MDWIGRVNGVIHYIEDHLDGEIDPAALAAIACCSVYNLQRMFSFIADKPLSEYIRERRLTMAAFDLINGNDRIIDLAVKYGYDSADAFSRAFQRYHNVLPSRARTETVLLKSCPVLSFHITIKGATEMNYQIEQWPAFTITGFAYPIKTAEAFDVIPGIWQTAWNDGTMKKLHALFRQADYRPAGFIGMAAGGQWGASEEMEYRIGVTTHVDRPDCAEIPAPEGMVQRRLPAATWVIFNADGELPAAVQRIYKQFYSEWLPSSGYELEDLPVLECYKQENGQEVWIAIRKP